jgi:hypothetical protein
MIESIQKFLRGPAGKIAATIILVVAAAAIYSAVRSSFGQSDAAAYAAGRPFICAESGKVFHYDLKIGDTIPVRSPYSGKCTGYPAELCYWTKDGKPKPEPTYVLLNAHVGKPGPTFCPDCGRLVVGLNPTPNDGGPPPPTEQEFRAKHSH